MGSLMAILRKFEESMIAASFAEAGEFETANWVLGLSKNANKRVLLGTDKTEIKPITIGNALRLCQRIGGNLEIFHMLRLPGGTTEKELRQEKEMIEALVGTLLRKGVVYRPVRAEGCLADALLGHVATRRDILCVVFDALEAGEARCFKAKEKMIARFQSLSCPVMIYGDELSLL